MELAAKIILAVFALLAICFIAGFIDTWWEQRQYDKANREKGER